MPVGQIGSNTVLDHGYCIGLSQAQAFGASTVQRSNLGETSDSAHKAGEDSGLTDLSVETELETDVSFSILIIVDVHCVTNVGIKGKVVGSVGGLEEPVDVEDHGYAVGVIVTDKGVPVSHVRAVVECGDWGLAMAGRKQAGRNQHHQRHGEGHNCFESLH